MVEPSWTGRRVSIRRVVERQADGRLLFGDVVGDLVGLDAQTAVVQTRTGPIEVPRELIAIAKLVPASTADELALQAIASRGMRAREIEELGGWLLRADHGYLRRANSVLPLRQLGMPLDEGIARASDWYRQRDLPLRIATPTEARRLLDAELGERGWVHEVESHVMTARLDQLAVPPADDPRIEIAAAPDESWLGLFRGGTGASDPGRALLTRHDRAVFVTLREDGEALAVGRGVVDDGWLGVSAVEVTPPARRRGFATAVMAQLWRWGARQSAEHTYLQVEVANTGAVQLYERLGYWNHHDYRYWTEPSQD